MTNIPIYTIGYGARAIEAFMDVLKANNIAYLIDVRSRPYSRYKPDFAQEALEQHLRAQGIRYVFMGHSLGGQPADPDCYTDGKVDYDKCVEKAFYQEGIARVAQAWKQQLPVVLMCSEGKPEQCHRSKLIGRTLDEQGIPVVHIDEQDQLLTQADVMDRITANQPSLFGPTFPKLTSRKRYTSDTEESP
jgi:uncharacterized protein (DUF488 family)